MQQSGLRQKKRIFWIIKWTIDI